MKFQSKTQNRIWRNWNIRKLSRTRRIRLLCLMRTKNVRKRKRNQIISSLQGPWREAKMSRENRHLTSSSTNSKMIKQRYLLRSSRRNLKHKWFSRRNRVRTRKSKSNPWLMESQSVLRMWSSKQRPKYRWMNCSMKTVFTLDSRRFSTCILLRASLPWKKRPRKNKGSGKSTSKLQWKRRYSLVRLQSSSLAHARALKPKNEFDWYELI